ncbi:MAG TPA: hypothetical protein IAC82_03565 [Candidatus Merdivicinus intestinigallinarum]|nr:hypothetical protein [Candidatus Merdivicinus intestinigallinarum]
MERYLAKIKGRIWLLRGLVLLCAAAVFVLGELSSRGILLDSRTQTEFARSYASFILFGEMIAGLWLIHRNKKFLRDREQASEQRRREMDERRILISDKSGGTAAGCLLFLFANGAVVLAFVSMEAFYALFAALLAVLALKGGMTFYFSRKYGI